MNGDIIIRGASEHNLKHINVKIPRNSLTVVTGLSGSGKSSLAFDTLYAEGQRRYVESLSAYARQFLDRMQKPKVEHIEGLSPAIAIEQRSAGSNPRSTVATVTEIYDYLRLLYAHTGIPHCPKCGKELAAQSAEAICEKLLTIPEGRKMMILAPYITGRKGELRDVIEKIRRDGFVRVRIDGKITELTDEMKPLAKTLRHDIEAVVDRLVTGSLDRSRLNDSVETALKCGDGELIVMVEETDPAGSRSWKEERISERLACVDCGVSFGRMEPRNFSFNSPFGACPHCNGLGTMLVMPLLFRRFNYKQILIFTSLMGSAASFIVYFIGYENFWACVPFFVIGCIPLGAINVCIGAMVADSLDYMEWKTGVRLTGLASAIQGFVSKFDNAIATSFIIIMYMIVHLDVASISASVTANPLEMADTVRQGMFSLVSLIPAISLLLCTVPMFFYDLVGKKKEKITRELADQRKERGITIEQ